MASARPVDCEFVDFGESPQPEMDAAVVLREITGSGKTLRDLLTSAGLQFNLRADSVPVALFSFQLHCQPVIVVLRNVMQQRSRRAEIYQKGIDSAVVVVVAKARAAR